MGKTNFAISESAIEALTKAMSEALAKMASVEMTEFLTKPTMWAISDPVIELLTKELSDSVTKVMMEIAVPEWLTKAMIGNISSALSMLVVNNPAILAESIKSHENQLKDLVELLGIRIAYILANQD